MLPAEHLTHAAGARAGERRTRLRVREKSAVLQAGLQALISPESAKRLAALDGTEPSLKPIPRRRSRRGKSAAMLVDTSVWVDHQRKRNSTLVALLESGEGLTHPFVIGELACGNLAQRAKVPLWSADKRLSASLLSRRENTTVMSNFCNHSESLRKVVSRRTTDDLRHGRCESDGRGRSLEANCGSRSQRRS